MGFGGSTWNELARTRVGETLPPLDTMLSVTNRTFNRARLVIENLHTFRYINYKVQNTDTR